MNERERYIDNIRVWLTALVITHHAAITYGGPGSWYYSEKAGGLASGLLLTVFVATNQAFFMGLFFFLSSYFISPSYSRKGGGRFMTDRLVRLGIPLIFYSLVIAPVTVYMVITMGYDKQVSFADYYSHRNQWIELGVLWFTAALLLFTAVYWLGKMVYPGRPVTLPPPGNGTIFIFALGLGVVSFLVRVVFPIGWTLEPFGFQLAHFPQYIAMFVAGIVAHSNGWLPLTRPQGRVWGRVALALVVMGFPCIYLLKVVTNSELEVFLGGFTFQSFVNSLWEQLLGVSLIVAVMAIGAHRWNIQRTWMKALARSAYAVYIIHPMVLVLVALLLKEVHLPALFKFVVTASLSVTLSFTIGGILVRIPGVNRVV